MATMLSQKLVEAQEANDTVKWFLRKFEVGKLLSVCRAHKAKGFSVVELFTYLLGCMVSPISTYMSMRIGSFREAFSKNTLYRFCNNAGINWHKFVRLLSEKIISGFIRPATSEKRIEYFIFDDTPFAKSGKKKVSELTGHNERYLYELYQKHLSDGIDDKTGNHYRDNRRLMSYEEETQLLLFIMPYPNNTDRNIISQLSCS